VFDKLSGLEFGKLPTALIELKSEVTPAHIFHDLYHQSQPRYRNQFRDVDVDGLPFYDFVAGWVALAQDAGADVTDAVQIPYSASDILALPDGLGRCGFGPPEPLCRPNIIIRPNEDPNSNSGPKLTTTLSPIGSISDPHIDGCGTGLFLVQLFGEKLLFTWPASTHNLQWMEDRHGIKRGPLKLLDALDELSGMSVNMLHKFESVELEPGMIHAVMSLSPSAIAGWDFANILWLENSDLKRQMLWEAGMAKKQRLGGLSDRYNIGRYVGEDIRLWELVNTLSNPGTGIGEAVRRLLTSIREAM
jgi:hypothetical protein